MKLKIFNFGERTPAFSNLELHFHLNLKLHAVFHAVFDDELDVVQVLFVDLVDKLVVHLEHEEGAAWRRGLLRSKQVVVVREAFVQARVRLANGLFNFDHRRLDQIRRRALNDGVDRLTFGLLKVKVKISVKIGQSHGMVQITNSANT